MIAVLMIAQISLAGPLAREVKPMSRDTHLTELSKDSSFKEAREKLKAGKELSAKEKASLVKLTDAALAGVSVSAVNIQLLVQVKPEILAEVQAKAGILKSTTATKEQKDLAELDLKILDAGGRSLDVNSPTFKSDLEVLETASKVENYANSSVLSFKAEFIKALDSGKSIEKAVLVASKNKFDAKKLKELCI